MLSPSCDHAACWTASASRLSLHFRITFSECKQLQTGMEVTLINCGKCTVDIKCWWPYPNTLFFRVPLVIISNTTALRCIVCILYLSEHGKNFILTLCLKNAVTIVKEKYMPLKAPYENLCRPNKYIRVPSSLLIHLKYTPLRGKPLRRLSFNWSWVI